MSEIAHPQSSPGDRSRGRGQRTKSHKSRFTTALSRARSSPSPSNGKVAPVERPARRYGSARISGSANAVLGDVRNYNYYQSADAETALVHHDAELGIDLDAISKYDPRREEWLRIQPRIPETCQWIFRAPEYRRWYSGDGPPILVCLGSVGCGKSTTAGAVVDFLHQDESQSDRGVITFFVNTSPNYENTVMGLLRALIKQLVAHHHETKRELHNDTQSALKEAFRDPESLQDLGTLTRLLELLITGPEGYTFVIDGIDYLQEKEVLSYLKVVRAIFENRTDPRSSSKLIMFCRETLGRGIRPESLPSSTIIRIGLAHLKHDIYTYVDYLIAAKQLDREITTDDALLDEIKGVLKANSSKMFLWIRLQILSIWDPDLTTCDQDIKDQLSSLPEGLDEIYTRCLTRIESTNNQRSQDIAPKAFRWVASAKQPLTDMQAREAVSLTSSDLPL